MYLFFSRSDQSRCRFCPGNLFPQFAPCSSVQAIKVILLWPCRSEKPQPAGATFQELVHVVQVGNNLISRFFLVALRGKQYFPTAQMSHIQGFSWFDSNMNSFWFMDLCSVLSSCFLSTFLHIVQYHLWTTNVQCCAWETTHSCCKGAFKMIVFPF